MKVMQMSHKRIAYILFAYQMLMISKGKILSQRTSTILGQGTTQDTIPDSVRETMQHVISKSIAKKLKAGDHESKVIDDEIIDKIVVILIKHLKGVSEEIISKEDVNEAKKIFGQMLRQMEQQLSSFFYPGKNYFDESERLILTISDCAAKKKITAEEFLSEARNMDEVTAKMYSKEEYLTMKYYSVRQFENLDAFLEFLVEGVAKPILQSLGFSTEEMISQIETMKKGFIEEYAPKFPALSQMLRSVIEEDARRIYDKSSTL